MGKPETDTLRCPTCGYNLTGLAINRCPECGTAFDPRRLRTGGEPMSDRRAAWLMVQVPLLFTPMGIAFSVAIILSHGVTTPFIEKLSALIGSALAICAVVNSIRLTRGLLVRRIHHRGLRGIAVWLTTTFGLCISQLLLAALGFFAVVAVSAWLTGTPLW